jgi:hypothetical protein
MAGDSFRIHFLFSEWSTYSTRDSRFFSFSPFWPLDSVHVHSKRCHDEAWRWPYPALLTLAANFTQV